MTRRLLTALCFLVASTANIQAAEITTCIIDTSIKTNQVFYYFPLSKTLLRCDHVGAKNPQSLKELYADNWRLVYMQSPILVDQGKPNAAYTPPVLYLERTSVPAAIDKKPKANEVIDEGLPDESEDNNEPSGGGLFKFFGGDSTDY